MELLNSADASHWWRAAFRDTRLLPAVRTSSGLRHLSWRTEAAYVGGSSASSGFTGRGIPPELGEGELVAFLAPLAVAGRVAPSTQTQASSALLFLSVEVLGRPASRMVGWGS